MNDLAQRLEICDIKSYVDSHKNEYSKFLEKYYCNNIKDSNQSIEDSLKIRQKARKI